MTGEFLLNGHYQVSVFWQQISILDVVLEYSGSDQSVERINSTSPLKSDIFIYVLSVGNLNPPNIQYKYMISTKNNNLLNNEKIIKKKLFNNSQNNFSNYNDLRLQYHTQNKNNNLKKTNYNWKYLNTWTECSSKCQGFKKKI